MELTIEVGKLPLRAPFRISDRVFESVEALVATVTADGIQGRGEGQGVYYLGETAESMRAQIEAAGVSFGQKLTRSRLQVLLPPVAPAMRSTARSGTSRPRRRNVAYGTLSV